MRMQPGRANRNRLSSVTVTDFSRLTGLRLKQFCIPRNPIYGWKENREVYLTMQDFIRSSFEATASGRPRSSPAECSKECLVKCQGTSRVAVYLDGVPPM